MDICALVLSEAGLTKEAVSYEGGLSKEVPLFTQRPDVNLVSCKSHCVILIRNIA